MALPIKPSVPVINWSHPLTKGLVLDVPFFERGGTQVRDIVSKQFGTITQATFTKDRYGTEMNFPGSTATDRITFSDRDGLDLTNTFTFMSLVNPTSAGTSSAARIFAKEGGLGTAYDMLMGATNSYRVFLNNTLYASSNNVVTFGAWQLLTVTFDKDAGSNQIKFYVNAAAAGTQTRNTAISGNTASLLIGNNTSLARCFDGKMDFVRIYNRVLTVSEIDMVVVNPYLFYYAV